MASDPSSRIFAIGVSLFTILMATTPLPHASAQNNSFGLNTEGEGFFNANSSASSFDPLANLPATGNNSATFASSTNASANGFSFEELPQQPDNTTGALDSPVIAPDPAVQSLPDSTTAPSNPLDETVSLDLRAIPLAEVLRTIAEAARLNLVIGTSVPSDRLVTMRLNTVTYRSALELILNLYSLKAENKNNIIRVEQEGFIQQNLEDKQALQAAEWNAQPKRIMIWKLHYAQASQVSTVLTNMVQRSFPGLTQFAINQDERTNQLIIESIPEALERIKTVLRILDRKIPQVLIEARIIEAARDLGKSLGVSWGTRFGLDGQRGLSTDQIFPNYLIGSIGGAGAVGLSAPQPGAGLGETQLGTTTLSLGSINGMINLDAVIRAYEEENLANVIASPKIVVEDQKQALIRETTNSSFTQAAFGGSAQVQISFELNLTVTPRVADNGNINLEISVSRGVPNSGVGSRGASVTNRNAQTNLTVLDGETAVIGGLYQASKLQSQGRIPLLGSIPIIGALFRTSGNTLTRSELMVLITPRILKSDDQVASSPENSLDISENLSNNYYNENNNYNGNNNANNYNYANGNNNSNSLNNDDEDFTDNLASLNGNGAGTNQTNDFSNSSSNGTSNQNNSQGNNFDNNANNSNFGNNEFGNNNFGNNNFGNNSFGNNNFGNNSFGNNNFGNNNFGNNNFGNNNFGNNNFGNNNFGNNNFENNNFGNNEFGNNNF
jgi:type IV pilus assembly protein PilQ